MDIERSRYSVKRDATFIKGIIWRFPLLATFSYKTTANTTRMPTKIIYDPEKITRLQTTRAGQENVVLWAENKVIWVPKDEPLVGKLIDGHPFLRKGDGKRHDLCSEQISYSYLA